MFLPEFKEVVSSTELVCEKVKEKKFSFELDFSSALFDSSELNRSLPLPIV